MRRLAVLVLIASTFGLISCSKKAAPKSTAITCTTTTSTTSTTTSVSSCLDPTTGISIAIAPPTVSVIVGIPTQFRAGVSGGTNSIVTWQVNSITGGDDTVGRIDASGNYIAPGAVPSPATVNVMAVSYEDPKLSVTSTVTILALPTVTISPTSGTLTSGTANTMTFTSTVTGAPTMLVHWLVNGVLGGNATFGTISAAGVYTAPKTTPIGSTVTVSAASQDSPTSLKNATVTISGYSTSSFQGQFAFSMAGKNASGAFYRAGSFSADGNGNLNGGLEDVNAAACATARPISFVGTYTIGSDGRGMMQFADGCTPSTFSFVLVNNDQLQITGFDASGTATGQANLQDPTFFNASGLNGVYVFDFAGAHNGAPLSQIGEFTSDGLGNITSGLMDINDSAPPTPSIASQVPFTGSYFVNSNGRGTATFGSRKFSFYIVSRGSAKFVGTDPQTTAGGLAGVTTQQFTSAPFDASSINGNIAFLLAGPIPYGTIATAGSFTANGNGILTTGALDENKNGAATSNAAFSNSTYKVSSNGRGILTFTAGSQTYNLVFYLSSPGNAVLQETDLGRTSDGLFVQQQNTPFSLASGNYALQTAGLSGASVQTMEGQVGADGSGKISSGTIDINTGGALTQLQIVNTVSNPSTYSIGTNGRGTLILNPATDNRNFALYIVNSTQVFAVGIDPASAARLASGALYRQF